MTAAARGGSGVQRAGAPYPMQAMEPSKAPQQFSTMNEEKEKRRRRKKKKRIGERKKRRKMSSL
jgi:hypothetical protein